MHISPSEPTKLKALGKVSSLSEHYGADVFWVARGLKVGVQRKELGDFINSVQNGLLAKEIMKMRQLDIRLLIVEGMPKWGLEGELIGRDYGQWNQAKHQGQLWSLQAEGVWFQNTSGLDDTVGTIKRFRDWTNKVSHQSLSRRAGPVSVWGSLDNIDFVRHMVMGLDDVGPELAARIVGDLGCPFGWVVGKKDLEKVKGIGKKKAEKIWNQLKPLAVPTSNDDSVHI